MRRLVCLDGLRGVLAFYVMLSHTLPFAPLPGWLLWLFSHGGAAVDVFFILSGLVIVQSLASFDYRAAPVPDRPRHAHLSGVPGGLLVAVAVQPLATGFERMAWIAPDSPARFIWSGGWPSGWALFIATHLTMTHGLFPNGVLPDVWVGFLGAAWSLSTEWQFYLLALLIGRAAWGCGGWPGCSWRSSAAAIAWHAVAPDAWQFSRAFLPNKAQYFALGIVSAIVVREGRQGLGAYLTVLGVRWCCAWCRAASRSCCRRCSGRCVWRPSYVSAADITIVPADGYAGRWRRRLAAMGLFAVVLRSRPLVWLGAVSYCIYLVNEPVQKLLGVALAVVVQGNAALFTALWLPGAVVLPLLAAWWLHEWIEAPHCAGAEPDARDMPAAPVPISAG